MRDVGVECESEFPVGTYLKVPESVRQLSELTFIHSKAVCVSCGSDEHGQPSQLIDE